ncbi:MAG: DmsE family decaheme c-type cytochrome [Gammaproteobacteria bacterium]|nr:DmsE family decaheme c-type cytochrome [Gammaproteobacteria bacterium]NNF59728.1 DmsE family decaheme c-type cytochrome [Gammaproteobacteria bacterium]
MRHRWRRAAALLLALLVTTPVAAQDDDKEPEYTRTGADTCLRCHGEGSEYQVLGIFKTPHGNAFDERAPFGQLQCEACHGPGGEHAGRVRRGQERPGLRRFGQGSPTPVNEQNEVCEGCHKAAVGTSWHGGMHDSAEVSCADCHQVHVSRDPVLETRSQPQVCYECHRSQKADSFKFSAHPLRFGKMTCTACHNPHGTLADAELRRGSVNDTCYQCHAEKRGPFLWEHAPVAEDCSLCHASHGSNHPAMLTRRAPLLCQQCHSQAGHPSVARSSSGIPAQGGSTFVGGHGCANCHSQVHGSNHPSGAGLTR